MGSLRAGCLALLAAAFALDLVTPQLFVAAILLNAPIALSSLVLDGRFTRLLIGLALVANVVAGYANGAAEHHHWEPVALANRAIAGLSFLLVGFLAVAAQDSALRAGELAAREARAARQRIAHSAVEAVRSSMSAELIERAVAREASAAVGAHAAWLFVTNAGLTTFTILSARAGSAEVATALERPSAAVVSLLERVVAERRVLALTRDDALGRLLLDEFGAEYALAAPGEEHASLYGVLVTTRTATPFDAYADEALRYFVQQSGLALAQAALFAQLAERNEQLAQANSALIERSDVIRDIVYALSHDVRTPLAAAAMTMRQALDGAFGPLPAAYADILRRSLASNDELQRLAETLLLVSRYESGDGSRRRERVALAPLANEVVSELSPLWQSKGLQVEASSSADVAVDADPGELRRAVINLVANAVAFTPRGGRVDIEIAEHAGEGTLTVSDTGYGISESDRRTLFARVHTGASKPGAGSGLGLYLVRRVAESHGGTIEYEARTGGGSIFRLNLPLAAAAVNVA